MAGLWTSAEHHRKTTAHVEVHVEVVPGTALVGRQGCWGVNLYDPGVRVQVDGVGVGVGGEVPGR